MTVEQQLGDFNHPRCPLPHQLYPSCFQKVRTCQLDCGWTVAGLVILTIKYDFYSQGRSSVPPKILLMN